MHRTRVGRTRLWWRWVRLLKEDVVAGTPNAEVVLLPNADVAGGVAKAEMAEGAPKTGVADGALNAENGVSNALKPAVCRRSP